MSVLVIGGGASGMVAALMASKEHQVTILEQRDRIGHKLLATGNGRCNLTNNDQSLSHYHGGNQSQTLVRNVLQQYNKEDMLSFFRKLGIETKERNGYIYPNSEQASAVLDVLRFALSHAGVNIITDCSVENAEYCDHTFTVKTNKGNHCANDLILATGSKAGISGKYATGYHLAEELGHSIVPVRPALVQLISDEKMCKSLAGIRVSSEITLLNAKNECVSKERGEIQFTAYGISGIAAMQVSHLVSGMCEVGQKCSLSVDLLPDVSVEDCQKMLIKRKENNGYKDAGTFLIGLFHKNLGIHLMKRLDIPAATPISDLTEEQLQRLAHLIKSLPFCIKGTKDFIDAQVCAGGVDLSQVKDNLESALTPGLYFAGEMLDIHGDCGGYNLQWAFCSGMLAGSLRKL